MEELRQASAEVSGEEVLSPEAEAILHAITLKRYDVPYYAIASIDEFRKDAAAVLWAASKQIAITNGECPGVTLWEQGFLAGAAGAQQALLAIAAELDPPAS
tara:strand:+ start:114 stop:419 length:306 start_codon:yes stop_codon:yes gene_type:complete